MLWRLWRGWNGFCMKNKFSEGEFAFYQTIGKFVNEMPVTEYRFNNTRKWRFDFAWVDKKIAVEIEGGHWGKSRHGYGKGFENDNEKYNEAQAMGWNVFRFTTNKVLDFTAQDFIKRIFEERKAIETNIKKAK
jgi:very-short-patch-repair endonuclease